VRHGHRILWHALGHVCADVTVMLVNAVQFVLSFDLHSHHGLRLHQFYYLE